MIRTLIGDCRDVLPTLPANSVQCCVTSPPYYGLRDYGTALWDGGDAECDHVHENRHQKQGASSARVGRSNVEEQRNENFRDACGKCGARRIDRQIGLEASPDEYIATMVAVFREVRRVLRDDGTLWLNIGDSYSSGSSGDRKLGRFDENRAMARSQIGVKPKDLLMMPARLALALQADGWWLRSAIVWSKPNPMPESVTDRPTSAYEMVYLLAKSARYFYDSVAIAEPLLRPEEAERETPARFGGADKYILTREQSRLHSGNEYRGTPTGTRNARNVWTIATEPFSESHFAVFPSALAERCIRAGTSERGCCSACGAPWTRIMTKAEGGHIGATWGTHENDAAQGNQKPSGQKMWDSYTPPVTTGWAPGCACNAPVVPCTVLDPFSGAGTTLLVADRLQRHAIGIELNPAYAAMGADRVRRDAPLLAEIA